MGDATLSAGDGQRGRAPRHSRSRQPAARQVLRDPAGKRQEPGDNTRRWCIMRSSPAQVERDRRGQGWWFEGQIESSRCSIHPDDLVDWVLKTVPTMGAGWCPPGILSVGIGGTPEKRSLLAKESLDGRSIFKS